MQPRLFFSKRGAIVLSLNISDHEEVTGWFLDNVWLTPNVSLMAKAHSLHRKRGRQGVPYWHGWCYCPINVALGIAQMEPHLYHVSPGNELDHEIRYFIGTAAWAMGKGIYDLDESLLKALWQSPVEQVPVRALLTLPEWCIYVNCRRSVNVQHLSVLGFFAFLDDRFTGTQRLWPELQIIAIVDGGAQLGIFTFNYYVPLVMGQSLVDSLNLLAQRVKCNSPNNVDESLVDFVAADYSENLGPFLAVVEFICRVAPHLKRIDSYPRKQRVAFDDIGDPICENTIHRYALSASKESLRELGLT